MLCQKLEENKEREEKGDRIGREGWKHHYHSLRTRNLFSLYKHFLKSLKSYTT